MLRVLVASSFSGSSRYLKPLLERVVQFEFCVLAQGVGLDTFINDNIDVDYNIENGDGRVNDIVINYNPHIIIVVPQYSNSLEKKLICIANELSIPVIAAIEHWSFYIERFSLMNDKNTRVIKSCCYIPTYISVNDNYARNSAIKAGLPEKLLRVTGNPALEFRWSDVDINAEKKKYYEKVDINKKNILFISEPHSENFPKGSFYYQGFTELDVLKDLLIEVSNIANIYIQPHPQDSLSKFDPFIKNDETSVFLCTSDMLTPKLIEVDCIIGMGSMLLIEAALINEHVISYRPNQIEGFAGNALGYTKLVTNRNYLKESIVSCFNSCIEPNKKNVFSGSLDQLTRLISKTIKIDTTH